MRTIHEYEDGHATGQATLHNFLRFISPEVRDTILDEAFEYGLALLNGGLYEEAADVLGSVSVYIKKENKLAVTALTNVAYFLKKNIGKAKADWPELGDKAWDRADMLGLISDLEYKGK